LSASSRPSCLSVVFRWQGHGLRICVLHSCEHLSHRILICGRTVCHSVCVYLIKGFLIVLVSFFVKDVHFVCECQSFCVKR
jgi:hypothetical protein